MTLGIVCALCVCLCFLFSIDRAKRLANEHTSVVAGIKKRRALSNRDSLGAKCACVRARVCVCVCLIKTNSCFSLFFSKESAKTMESHL